MSFGINAANLSTEGLELDIPSAAGGGIKIVLGQSGGLSGRYEQDAGRIALRKIAAHQLSLEKLELPLAHGSLRVEAPSILSGLAVDAELGGGRPFDGSVTLASIVARLVFERGPLLARAGLRLEHAFYERSAHSGQRVEIGSAHLDAVRIELLGQAVAHAEHLSLRGVRVTIDADGELTFKCSAAQAEAVVIEHQGRTVQLGQVALLAGLELQGGALRWPELTLEQLAVVAPELPRHSGAPPSQPSSERAALDLPLLDLLQGQLAFDLLLDVRLPILPDRRATHSIRVPIERGTMNFKQLERCLSGLEDALFDFEVNEEGLIFELDPIPGLTADNVTLVTWPLEGRDHVLAKTQQRIRLRRLLDYRLSPKLTGGDSPRPSRPDRPSPLRRLHVGNIETVLRLESATDVALPGLGTLRLGTPEQPALGELTLSGQIEHAPHQPPTATELRVDARDLVFGASITDRAGRRVEIEQLSVQRVDSARLGLLGLHPQSASLHATGLRLAGVELRGWLRERSTP